MAKRGRPVTKPLEPPVTQAVNVLDPADEQAAREHFQQIIDEYGGGLPWHPLHYYERIATEMHRSAEAFVRAGGYLIVAQAYSAHGQWLDLLEQLRLSPRSAQRMMLAARRLLGSPNTTTSSYLAASNTTASTYVTSPGATRLLEASGGTSKLIELLSLPEEEFQALKDAGETPSGLSVDDVAQMTTSELREALREARKDLAAREERQAKLQKQVDRAEMKAAKATREWRDAAPDERMVKLRRDIETAAGRARLAISASSPSGSSLASRIADLVDYANEIDEDYRGYLDGVVGEFDALLQNIRDRYLLPGHQR